MRNLIGYLLLLGVIGSLFSLLYLYDVDRNPRLVVPPHSATEAVAEVPPDTPSLSQRVHAVVFNNGQMDTTVLTLQVIWADDREPAVSAAVTLTPMRDAMGTSVSQPLLAQTNASGRVCVKIAELLRMDKRNAMPWMKVHIEAEGGEPENFLFQRAYFGFAFAPPRSLFDDFLILRLRRVYGLYGTVYGPPDAAGQSAPVAGAEVSLTSMEGQRGDKTTTTLTNAEGRYEFRRVVGEAFQLAARAGNRAARGRNIGLEKGKLNGPFDLNLEDGFPLTVLVNDYSTQAPLAQAVVEAESNGLRTRAETDAQGFAEFRSLPLGRTALLARAEGYQTERFYVEVTGTPSDLTLFSLRKGGRVKIRTVDSEKSPVPDVDLQLGWQPMDSTLSVRTDEKGEAEADGLPLRTGISVQALGEFSLQNGCNFALSGAPEEKEVCVTVWTLKSNQADVHKTRQGWISGTVVNEANEPVAGAIVTTLDNSSYSSALQSISAITHADGRFLFKNLTLRSSGRSIPPANPQEAELSICDETLRDGLFRPTYFLPVAVMTRADGYQPSADIIRIDSEDRVVLKAKQEIKGVVLDKETQTPVRKFEIFCYEPGNQATRRKIISDKGEFTLDSLIGEFSVLAEGYLDKSLLVAREKSQDLTILLEKSSLLEGAVVDAATGAPLENVCVGNSRSFGEKPYEAFFFDENNTNADAIDFTNAQGAFRFETPFTEGGLVFIREDLEKLWVKTVDLEKYRDEKTGKRVFPMNPQPAPGSLVLDWFVRENSPASPNLQNNICILHSFGNPRHDASIPLKEKPVFSYNNGRFRYDNIKPGEYYATIPNTNEEGRVTGGYTYKTFKIESGKTTTVGCGIKTGETISNGVAP
jgi:hypothetical protein